MDMLLVGNLFLRARLYWVGMGVATISMCSRCWIWCVLTRFRCCVGYENS